MTTQLKREAITVVVAPLDWEQNLGNTSAVLLRALERQTSTPWRMVCPTVVVECVEPYRTLVLNAAAIEALREQQQAWNEQQSEQSRRDDVMASPFQFTTDLYAPLSPETRSL